MGNKKYKAKKRKRVFCGNKHTGTLNAPANVGPMKNTHATPSIASVSSRKVTVREVDESTDVENFNIIINFSILKNMMNEIASCPECDSGIIISDDNSKRRGFLHKLIFKCSRCDFEYSTFTSHEVDKSIKKQGRKFFDINLKMVIAFHEIGKGHRPLIDFARIANMSSMSVNAFDYANTVVQEAYKASAEQSTREAATKVKEIAKEKTHSGEALVQVSLDGSWQKRGHSSFNGVDAPKHFCKERNIRHGSKFSCYIFQ